MTWILIIYFFGSGAAMTQVDGVRTEAECHAIGQQWQQHKRPWGTTAHYACLQRSG